MKKTHSSILDKLPEIKPEEFNPIDSSYLKVTRIEHIFPCSVYRLFGSSLFHNDEHRGDYHLYAIFSGISCDLDCQFYLD